MVHEASLGYASTLKSSPALREPQWSQFCDVSNQCVSYQHCHIFHFCQQSTLSKKCIPFLIIKSECSTHAVIWRITQQTTYIITQIDMLFLAGSKKLGQWQSLQSGWMPGSKTSDPSSSLGCFFFQIFFHAFFLLVLFNQFEVWFQPRQIKLPDTHLLSQR